MRDILERLTETDKTSQDEFSYDTELEVHVDGLEEGEESGGPKEVTLTYSIYTEWRSWGLKDISVVPKGKVEFEVEIVDVEGDVVDTLSISVDSDNIGLVWVSGANYVPESFVVRVDRTGKLIEADLNFYFQDYR